MLRSLRQLPDSLSAARVDAAATLTVLQLQPAFTISRASSLLSAHSSVLHLQRCSLSIPSSTSPVHNRSFHTAAALRLSAARATAGSAPATATATAATAASSQHAASRTPKQSAATADINALKSSVSTVDAAAARKASSSPLTSSSSSPTAAAASGTTAAAHSSTITPLPDLSSDFVRSMPSTSPFFMEEEDDDAEDKSAPTAAEYERAGFDPQQRLPQHANEPLSAEEAAVTSGASSPNMAWQVARGVKSMQTLPCPRPLPIAYRREINRYRPSQELADRKRRMVFALSVVLCVGAGTYMLLYGRPYADESKYEHIFSRPRRWLQRTANEYGIDIAVAVTDDQRQSQQQQKQQQYDELRQKYQLHLQQQQREKRMQAGLA